MVHTGTLAAVKSVCSTAWIPISTLSKQYKQQMSALRMVIMEIHKDDKLQ